jgi:hypothetical protein
MRRMVFAVMLALGMSAAFAGLATVQAQDNGFGPVPFTVHKANCPIDFEGNVYDACHGNVQEGVGFEITGFEMATDHFFTDANGVGTTMILENMSVTSDLALSEDEAFMTGYGAYVYCSDQNSDQVLFDGPLPEVGYVYFESLSTSQYVICDWYNLTAPENGEKPGDGPKVDVLPNTGAGESASVNSWYGLPLSLAFIFALSAAALLASRVPARGQEQ